VPIRAYLADNLEAQQADPSDHHRQIPAGADFGVHPQAGRATLRALRRAVSGSALNKTDRAAAGVMGDIQWRRPADLLVAEAGKRPDLSFTSSSQTGCWPPKTFPAWRASATWHADWNEDGRPEIFMLSTDEWK